jgi:MoaA/NifB/PqqE/SkfB family radical SAM enzyme
MKKQKARCTWHLNRNCNFNCEYCYVRHFKKDEPGHGVETDVKAFKSNNIDWQEISMSGGEPFIYPQFVELCKELTKFSKIIVTTNCSTKNVFDFADKIDPKKVTEIHCSVHIGQRPKNKYDDMIDKILYLRNKGFHVFISQVIHPRLLEEYKKTFEYFKSKGNILITPKVMEGIWHLKEYPNAYKDFEKRTMLKYAEAAIEQPSHNKIHRYATMVDGQLDWKNRLCLAGFSNMQIQYNGDAYRCHGDRRLLGNLYEGTIKLDAEPRICTKDLCSCESEGWYGHKTPGFIHQHQNLERIGKAYAIKVLSKLGWKP